MEDIDTPRVVRGSAVRIKEDLEWLARLGRRARAGRASRAPYTQSERAGIYDQALAPDGGEEPAASWRKDPWLMPAAWA
jgi:glutamyl/glutaminyl-tRNA synthetase